MGLKKIKLFYFCIKIFVYLYQQNNKDMILLKNTREGNLVKFNKNSDVYEVLEVGCFIRLKNMYTNKLLTVKSYTKKNNAFHDRKVLLVNFY